jgi:hypothetical protein
MVLIYQIKFRFKISIYNAYYLIRKQVTNKLHKVSKRSMPIYYSLLLSI